MAKVAKTQINLNFKISPSPSEKNHNTLNISVKVLSTKSLSQSGNSDTNCKQVRITKLCLLTSTEQADPTVVSSLFSTSIDFYFFLKKPLWINRIIRLFTSGTIFDVIGDTIQPERTGCVQRTAQKQAGTHDDAGTVGIVLYINPRQVQADPASVFLGEIHKDMNSCFWTVSVSS